MDLHLHTPASVDYQQQGVTYLEILQRAEERGLDIIAFTDHNTIAGYRQMVESIERLEFLEGSGRLVADEQLQLNEYRRLSKKILVLPGFEFTATFGFHILGIFPEDKPLREVEHILLNLNIPAEQLDYGSDTVGATTDVIGAYLAIAEAGGLAIAAHANSTHGVAMRGFTFGGQTRIAYTQDSNLNALEVTDLEKKGRRTTAAFFSGIKPEYPRRMHCIQGSDAHRLTSDQQRKSNLTLFLGLNADPGKAIAGILKPDQAIVQLEKEIGNRISPHLHCTIDAHETGGKTILRVLVPRGDDPPYVVDDYKIYVRAESETSQAVRDEIVGLVRRGKNDSLKPSVKVEDLGAEEAKKAAVLSAEEKIELAPRTGVEVVSVEERDGGSFYTVRDLRNGNVVKNVTLKSARRLWHYALTQYARIPSDLEKAEIQWQGEFGLLHQGKQGKRPNYDLVQQTPKGNRYYFGVTDDGIHGPWKQLVGQDEE
jgi:PHP family Zn ribbon phosphoesterase